MFIEKAKISPYFPCHGLDFLLLWAKLGAELREFTASPYSRWILARHQKIYRLFLGGPGTLILVFRSWKTHWWRNNWDKFHLWRETDIWLKLDWILSSKESELDWVALTLEKQREGRGEELRRGWYSDAIPIQLKFKEKNTAKEKETDNAKKGGNKQRGGCETKGSDEEPLQLAITGKSLSIKESLCSLSLSKEYQL